METHIVSRTKDKEMETRISVRALNTPNGCVVSTITKYSTSISNSSVFVPGYHFIQEMDEFQKIETWEDTAIEEGQKAYDSVKDTVKGIFK